jgi:hypothetical protein
MAADGNSNLLERGPCEHEGTRGSLRVCLSLEEQKDQEGKEVKFGGRSVERPYRARFLSLSSSSSSSPVLG